ncbi:MAG TPA: hypothetical protein V6C63_07140 [Allocoleopsis sp.]
MIEMKVTLCIKDYWPDGLSLEKAEEELKARGLDFNRRSLGVLRGRGTKKGEWVTPFKLAKYLSEKTGKKITAMDLLIVED